MLNVFDARSVNSHVTKVKCLTHYITHCTFVSVTSCCACNSLFVKYSLMVSKANQSSLNNTFPKNRIIQLNPFSRCINFTSFHSFKQCCFSAVFPCFLAVLHRVFRVISHPLPRTVSYCTCTPALIFTTLLYLLLHY